MENLDKMESFRKLGIGEDILKSLKEQKFESPTEIQEKTIPLVLSGKDVIAGAATGSGKTLVFGAAIIENCLERNGIQSLVLVPTRELAEQVARSIDLFSRHKALRIAAVYGGVSINPQISELRHADVVVGTPGRILDHLERRTLDLRNVKILVLDEADRMLDMGFIDDVKRIISQCPKYRQTMLFSATISRDISQLARDYMSDPQEVFAETNVDPTKLSQGYYDVQDNEKFSLLVHLLKNDKSGLVMVFCNTQRNTDFVAKNLKLIGINALAIHGGHSQDKRNKTMQKFHEKDVDVLECTDVAARGLDIKDVSHVYNYDSPNEVSQYTHRIGRTARAGEEGKAISIIGSRDYENFGRIKKHFHQIERQDVPEFSMTKIGFKHEPRFGGRNDRFGGESRGRFSRGSGGFRSNRGNFRGRNSDNNSGRSGGSRFSRRESRSRNFGRRF